MNRQQRKMIIHDRNTQIFQEWKDSPVYDIRDRWVGHYTLEYIGLKYKLAPSTIIRIVYRMIDLEIMADRLQ